MGGASTCGGGACGGVRVGAGPVSSCSLIGADSLS